MHSDKTYLVFRFDYRDHDNRKYDHTRFKRTVYYDDNILDDPNYTAAKITDKPLRFPVYYGHGVGILSRFIAIELPRHVKTSTGDMHYFYLYTSGDDYARMQEYGSELDYARTIDIPSAPYENLTNNKIWMDHNNLIHKLVFGIRLYDKDISQQELSSLF